MPYDATRKLFLPDFQPEQSAPDWLNMPDDAPIDAGPAASAFRDRFMSRPAMADAHGPMDHGGGGGIGPVGHEGVSGPMGAHGTDAQMKPKSL